MVSCDGPWIGFVIVMMIFVLPFALPVLAFGVAGVKRRWAGRIAMLVSVAGLGVHGISAWTHPADPRWLVAVFAPPALAWLIVERAPAKRWRVVAALVSAAPLVAGIAFALSSRLSYVSCI